MGDMTYISKYAEIGQNVKIGHGAVIYDNVKIGDNSFIGPYCVIGEPSIGYYRDSNYQGKKTEIGENSIIRSHTVIYEDVIIGSNFQTGHNAIIREQTIIGNNSSFGSNSEMPGKSKIGSFVRIHSKVMLSENNIIEDFVWIFPFVVLTNVKHPPLGGFERTHIKQFALIFANSTILPGVTIGINSVIGAGSLVTKDVGDKRLVLGNPAKDIKSIEDVLNEEGERIYPWQDYLKEYRGYPWQTV